MMKNLIERNYPESRFGGFSDIDGTICFYSRINALLKKEDILLDIGCGRGSYTDDKNIYRKNLRILKGKVNKVIGIDVDEAGKQNQQIDEFRKINSDGDWPIESNSIDIAICDQVLEHIENPERFFSECKRVIKRGGIICIRTTNKLGYIALGAKLIPQKSHLRIIHRIQDIRRDEDVFKTYFRCNTIKDLKTQLEISGFQGVVYGHDAEPGYFTNSNLGYTVLKPYQSLSSSRFKTILFVFARKIK